VPAFKTNKENFEMKKFVIALGMLSLGACAPVETGQVDPVEAALSGKTLVRENAELTVNPDGTITGFVGDAKSTPYLATWSVTNGNWCATTIEPENLAGERCREVTFEGSKVTFTGGGYPDTDFTITQ
jgi:hypothetical protein